MSLTTIIIFFAIIIISSPIILAACYLFDKARSDTPEVRLKDLEVLYSAGKISKEEYDARRAKIIAKL